MISIRPTDPKGPNGGDWETTQDGFFAKGQPMSSLIMFAYYPEGRSFWKDDRLEGAPTWKNVHYDIQAKVYSSDMTAWQNQGLEAKMLKAMLQTALSERCNLTLHHTHKEDWIYALVVGKKRPKLRKAIPSEPFPPHSFHLPEGGGVVLVPRGSQDPEVPFTNVTMKGLAAWLTRFSDRPVKDETGLAGSYDFTMQREGGDIIVSASSPLHEPPYVLSDIGLALKSKKESVDVLVIDHIDRPSTN